MNEGLAVTVCQFGGCGRKFRPRNNRQRYCGKECSYAQRLIREKEKNRYGGIKPKKKRTRSEQYRKKLIQWQQNRRKETTELFLKWESFRLFKNTSLKILFRMFSVDLSSYELEAVTDTWLASSLKKKRNDLLKVFHPTARYWRVRQISHRRPDVRQRRLEEVCGKIQHAYEKALTIIKNREKPSLFGRKR